jgi:hypothetical protein
MRKKERPSMPIVNSQDAVTQKNTKKDFKKICKPAWMFCEF